MEGEARVSAPDERVWTTAEVAEHYRVRPARVLGWVREGRLPVARRRPGKRGALLFLESDVMALDGQGRDVDPVDVAAIIDAELRRRKAERKRGA